MEVARRADAYVDTQAPWKLKKEGPERMETVLYVLAQVIKDIAIAMLPVTPVAAGKILDQLKVPEKNRYLKDIDLVNALDNGDHWRLAGTKIDKPEGVFPRIVIDEAA